MSTVETHVSEALRRARAPVTGCCPPFDPTPWEGRELQWQDKLFVREHVHCLLHVPLDFGKKVVRAQAKIEAAHAQAEVPLMLAEDPSPWRSELYIDVNAPVPGAEMERLSGTFLTRVFEGPYRDAGQWMAETRRWVAGKGREVEKLYLGYTTCPKCAKAYGKNYVVVFAKVKPLAS